ncbi:MAG: hypothetical protein ACRDP7_23750 [Trebonia sp.]
MAKGPRRAITVRPTGAITAAAGSPGIIVLDADLAVESISPGAERWLAEISEADPWDANGLAVRAAAARVAIRS